MRYNGGRHEDSPECIEYFNSLPLAQNIKNVAPILLCPLTQELVLTALENLKKGSSPGVDGSQQKIFSRSQMCLYQGCFTPFLN